MTRDNSYLVGNKFAKGYKPTNSPFVKGFTPWNKGIKGLHLSTATEFKSGLVPCNKMAIGVITQRKTKGGKIRQFIKIDEPNKWEEYSQYIWSKFYGSIIKGDIIHHMDGDCCNNEIDNLIALPRYDHPIFHGRWGLKPLNAEQLAYYKNRYLERMADNRKLW